MSFAKLMKGIKSTQQRREDEIALIAREGPGQWRNVLTAIPIFEPDPEASPSENQAAFRAAYDKLNPKTYIGESSWECRNLENEQKLSALRFDLASAKFVTVDTTNGDNSPAPMKPMFPQPKPKRGRSFDPQTIPANRPLNITLEN